MNSVIAIWSVAKIPAIR